MLPLQSNGAAALEVFEAPQQDEEGPAEMTEPGPVPLSLLLGGPTESWSLQEEIPHLQT